MATPSPAGNPGAQQMAGPPYPPQVAQIGGTPNVSVDVPVTAVLLFLFVISAVVNMTIFQVNRKRDHKFVFSALLFGFSMARITALTLRIAWATHPTNVQLAIAASVLASAGVLLLFVVNLIFTQRIVRAYHPHLGWHKATTWAFRILYFLVLGMLIMVITATVQSFFTLDPFTRNADRIVQLVASVFLAALAFLPIPVVLILLLVSRGRAHHRQQQHGPHPRGVVVDKFGTGRWRTKLALLLFTSVLLALGAGFRAGAAFAPRPLTDPAWYHHRACYYVFNYVIELIVVAAYAASRFDHRFYVPDGSSGPGHYVGNRSGVAAEKHAATAGVADYVNREDDVFGDSPAATAVDNDEASDGGEGGSGPMTPGARWAAAARKEQRGNEFFQRE